MPKSKKEASKKHGDTMEPLIERTGGNSPPREGEADDDATQFRDDDDEDAGNDDPDDRPDAGGRD